MHITAVNIRQRRIFGGKKKGQGANKLGWKGDKEASENQLQA
jgi:hypothetical protein